jgi:TolB-like protein/Flp pilus assembly protein TadD
VRRVGYPLIALLVALGAGLFWYYQRGNDAPVAKSMTATVSPIAAVTPDAKSIAVLPFADMSPGKDQEYMSDGIAEELLNLLAQVPDLKVIARTSSFAFKGQNIEIAEIARKLNVTHVLEGSVRTSGKQMRITAQLVRAADSTHLWSDRYDRPMDDIFAVQDEIASAIVQALQIRLKGGTLDRRAGGTQNLEAYQLYLRAVNETSRYTKASLDAAEEYASQAVKLDPNFGLAWFQLAQIADYKLYSGYLTHQEGYKRIQHLVEHALRLSPELAEAHVKLASLYLFRDFNWPRAKAELQRAIAIDATNTEVVTADAAMAIFLGNYDDAERKIRAGMQRDPLDFAFESSLSDIYFKTGRLTEAEAIARSAIERQPEAEGNHGFLAQILLLQGKGVAAIAELEMETGEQARAGSLPLVLHAAGRRTEAEAALSTLIQNWGNDYGQGVARVYAFMGNHDRAMEWLELAYQQKDSSLYNIVGSPLYGSLPDDPRFKAFLRNRLRLPV